MTKKISNKQKQKLGRVNCTAMESYRLSLNMCAVTLTMKHHFKYAKYNSNYNNNNDEHICKVP